MLPATPENAQPLTVVEGAVWKARTRLFSVSSMICGRETQSPVLAIVVCSKAPVPGLKTTSTSWARFGSVEPSLRLVFTAANTRPVGSACSVLMFRWSSTCRFPRIASRCRQDDAALGSAPSVCVDQYAVPVAWSVHMIPIWSFRNATMAERSSGVGFGSAAPGTTNGVPHPVPPGPELFTKTVLVVPATWVQVAQSAPVESLSMVSVSLLLFEISCGNPVSRV